MKPWENFVDVYVKEDSTSQVKRRYSVTGDILSYKRCPRLYSSQAERGFSPAQPSQRYFGTIIHEVLDKAHIYYAGKLDPKFKDKVPDDDTITLFFNQVDNALRAHGIRPFSPKLSLYVLDLIKKFNRIEGPSLYPRVIDTEYRLQNDQGDYILHGVVDVLASNTKATDPTRKIEIWDYKGMKRPKDSTTFGKRILADYTYQMQVYAMLYKFRSGSYPSKAVIYFVGELKDANLTSAPRSAVMEIKLDPNEMKHALDDFDLTVKKIQDSRTLNKWDPPDDGSVTAGKETCDACDIRFSCPVEKNKYKPKYP